MNDALGRESMNPGTPPQAHRESPAPPGAASAEVASSAGAAEAVRRPTPAAIALLIVGLWAILFNIIANLTWGHGRASFFACLGTVALLAGARSLARFLSSRLSVLGGFSSGFVTIFASVAVLVYLALDVGTAVQEMRDPDGQDFLIDIGANGYLASGFLFDQGKNPYSEKCQTWDPVIGDRGPTLPRIDPSEIENLSVDPDGTIRMFGFEYQYGYPYFPAMFLSFEPFRWIIPNFHSVRLGNLVFFLLSLVLVAVICSKLVRPADRGAAAALSLLAFLSFRAWGNELFHLGVTDLIISVYALCGFVALAYGRYFLAGFAFGLTLACKLLPGPFFFLLLMIYLWRKPGMLKAAMGFAASSLSILVPFIAADPAAFLTSTTLYYMTANSLGDNTSLYFFLPGTLKPLFLVGGAFAVFMTFVSYWRVRTSGLGALVRYSFLTYMVFVAFNKQIHLNHMISVYALGALALVVDVFAALEQGSEEARSHKPATR